MHIAYLITGGTGKKRKKYAEDFILKQRIARFDIHKVAPQPPHNTIGIDQIKNLIRLLSLSAGYGLEKAGVLLELQYATREAQNALLKLLEEPDIHTLIVATADRKESLLPTIVSRCRVHILPSEKAKYSPSVDKDIKKLLSSSSYNCALELAEKYQKKEKALLFLTFYLDVLRNELHTACDENTSYNKKYIDFLINTIQSVQKAILSVKETNISIRLLLENLFLTIIRNKKK